MSDQPRILGVIPARGGSKRLPRKNILPVAGIPLIHYSINAALGATRLSAHIVSTDDTEIRDIAQQAGGFAPFLRPAQLAGDEVRNVDVLLHALDWYEAEQNVRFDYVVLLQPTSPMRTAVHIDGAIEVMLATEYPTLASVTGPHKKRHQVIKRPLGNNGAEDFENLPHSSFYLYNASIYCVHVPYLRRTSSIFSNPQAIYTMPEYLIDIDDEHDLALAQLLLANSQDTDR